MILGTEMEDESLECRREFWVRRSRVGYKEGINWKNTRISGWTLDGHMIPAAVQLHFHEGSADLIPHTVERKISLALF
jgi:hypothetical protein